MCDNERPRPSPGLGALVLALSSPFFMEVLFGLSRGSGTASAIARSLSRDVESVQILLRRATEQGFATSRLVHHKRVYALNPAVQVEESTAGQRLCVRIRDGSELALAAETLRERPR